MTQQVPPPPPPTSAIGKPARLGLGLCNIRDLLTPDEQRKLNADLWELAQARRRAEAAAHSVYLA